MTLECPFGGRVKIYQPRRGYRYSIDAFLLTHFSLQFIAKGGWSDITAAELGSGSGVVSLGLALSEFIRHVSGIEIVPELVESARKSAALSGLEKKVNFIEGDLKDPVASGMKPGAHDLVVSNPPYRPVGKGRISPDSTRAVARHEVAAKLADVAGSASQLLKPTGAFCLVYVTERLPELLNRLLEAGLEPRRMRFVHPRPFAPAKMVLVESRKSSKKGLDVEHPLFVHDENGNYTPEMKAAFEGPP